MLELCRSAFRACLDPYANLHIKLTVHCMNALIGQKKKLSKWRSFRSHRENETPATFKGFQSTYNAFSTTCKSDIDRMYLPRPRLGGKELINSEDVMLIKHTIQSLFAQLSNGRIVHANNSQCHEKIHHKNRLERQIKIVQKRRYVVGFVDILEKND